MGDSSISDPMSFVYLDMLATILLNDTIELENQFETKVKFIIEQEQNCLENAKQLFLIDQFLDTLKNCVIQTELELQENEFELLEAEKVISNCEASLMDPTMSNQIINMQYEHSKYLSFLKLLLSADRSAAKCNQLKENIEHYNNEANKHLEPHKLITTIMDYHNSALVMLEEQINKFEVMTNEISNSYDEITKKLKINSLTTKCTCEMANVINNIFKN